MRAGALVWVMDRRGSMFAAKIVDGEPIREKEDRIEFLVLLWRRSRRKWAKIAAPWLVVRELTVEERAKLTADEEGGETYQPPRVDLVANARELLSRVTSTGWARRGRKAIG